MFVIGFSLLKHRIKEAGAHLLFVVVSGKLILMVEFRDNIYIALYDSSCLRHPPVSVFVACPFTQISTPTVMVPRPMYPSIGCCNTHRPFFLRPNKASDSSKSDGALSSLFRGNT